MAAIRGKSAVAGRRWGRAEIVAIIAGMCTTAIRPHAGRLAVQRLGRGQPVKTIRIAKTHQIDQRWAVRTGRASGQKFGCVEQRHFAPVDAHRDRADDIRCGEGASAASALGLLDQIVAARLNRPG